MTEETEPFMFSVQSFEVSIFCAVFCNTVQLQQERAPSWKENSIYRRLECSKRRLEDEEERGKKHLGIFFEVHKFEKGK